MSPIGLAWKWWQYEETEYQKELQRSAITTTSSGQTIYFVPVWYKAKRPQTEAQRSEANDAR